MDYTHPDTVSRPPRHSSLHPNPPLAPSPPPPPEPPLPLNNDHLPTYDQSQQAAPPQGRFPRWGSWIEKRGNERRRERDLAKAQGAVQPSAWNLPGTHSSDPDDADDTGEQRERDEQAEKRLSASFLGAAKDGARSRTGSAASADALGAGGGRKATQRLTKSVAISRVGGRFSKGIEEKPKCAVRLPLTAEGGDSDERFILIGTSSGLFLLDLLPSLSSATSRLSLGNPSAPSDEATIYCLWNGLGVHHIELCSEPTEGGAARRQEGPRGILLASVGREGEAQLRMWNLQSIVSLAKWRVYDANSIPLHLPSLTASAFAARSSAPTTATAEQEAVDRRVSLATNVKSVFSPSPSPHSSSPRAKGKGKALPPPLDSAPATVRPSLEAEYLLVDSSSSSNPCPHPPSSTHALSTDQPPTNPTERLALPLEWATLSVPLPLPKSAPGSVLLFRLFRMPPPLGPSLNTSASSDDEDESEDEDEEDLPPHERAKRREEAEERKRLFLFVATQRSVFLYESKPPTLGARRSWSLTREFFAPSTPKFLCLVRSTYSSPSSPRSKPRTSSILLSASSPPLTFSPASSSASSFSHPPDPSLLLGLSHRLVLIRLSDSSVTELDISPPPLPPPPAPSSSLSPLSHLSLQQTRSPPLPSSPHHHSTANRARSSSAASSASSLSGTPKSRHKPSASTSLANLASSVKERVAAFVEGQNERGVPVGMRSEGRIPMGKKKAVGDQGEGGGGGVLGSGGGTGMGGGGGGGATGKEGKWTAFEEVDVPESLLALPSSHQHRSRAGAAPAEGAKKLYFLTRGSSTFVLASFAAASTFPFTGAASSSASTSTAPQHPSSSHHVNTSKLSLTPLHVFTWPSSSSSASAPISHLSISLSPTPTASSHSRSAELKYAHLSLTAFTLTGLSIQEGLVSLAVLRAAFPSSAASKATATGASTQPFFRALPEALLRPPPAGAAAPASRGDERDDDNDDDDLSSTATLDFGRATGWLCSSTKSSGGAEGGAGGFFWTRAHSDYAVKRLVVNPPTPVVWK